MPEINKIGLVYMIENDGGEEVHPCLSSIFMEAATEAIDNMDNVSNALEFNIATVLLT